MAKPPAAFTQLPGEEPGLKEAADAHFATPLLLSGNVALEGGNKVEEITGVPLPGSERKQM